MSRRPPSSHRPPGTVSPERALSSSGSPHLVVELTEGKNREIRRMLATVGHEVTRLKRVAYGGLELGDLAPGKWRIVSAAELREAFPGTPLIAPQDSAACRRK